MSYLQMATSMNYDLICFNTMVIEGPTASSVNTKRMTSPTQLVSISENCPTTSKEYVEGIQMRFSESIKYGHLPLISEDYVRHYYLLCRVVSLSKILGVWENLFSWVFQRHCVLFGFIEVVSVQHEHHVWHSSHIELTCHEVTSHCQGHLCQVQIIFNVLVEIAILTPGMSKFHISSM